MKRKFLTLAFILAASTATWAQQSAKGNGTIKGKITEKTSALPIGFASVAISANGQIIS